MSKVASLTSALLAPKGRAAPAALIDQALDDTRQADSRTHGDSSIAEHLSRWRPAAFEIRGGAVHANTQAVATVGAPGGAHGGAVVLPMPIAEDDRAAGDHAHRKKLSLRLEPMRHLRLKLVSYHLGISAQELLTRALDRYIDLVAPELAQAAPLAAAGPVGLAELAADPAIQGD